MMVSTGRLPMLRYQRHDGSEHVLCFAPDAALALLLEWATGEGGVRIGTLDPVALGGGSAPPSKRRRQRPMPSPLP